MPDDSRIMHALQAGDPDALVLLFETYADPIYRLASRILQDSVEAEDIVQETFLKAITHLNRFEGRSKLGTWLYRIAYNASIERLRSQRETPYPAGMEESLDEPDALMPQVFVEWETPEAILMDAESLDVLDEAIQKLPESLQIVFVLRDIEGLSTVETAEVLAISPGAAKVRLHRARLALRELLAEYFVEDRAPKIL